MAQSKIEASVGIWKKGSATLTVVLEGDEVRVIPAIGNEFNVHVSYWLSRVVRFQDEGWVKEDSEEGCSEFTDEEEDVTKIIVRNSSAPSDPPKIKIPKDTVLRRKNGELFLMTRQDGGWNSYAYRVPSEAWVAERFNVRIGKWSSDLYGDYCPVLKATHRLVSKPPRPGDRKTG